jgi:hypothetical protein
MVSFRDIRRSTFRRFLPGWLSTLIGLPLIFKAESLLAIGTREFGLIAVFSSIALAGHALTLLLLRSRLRADAKLVDSKSFLIGACSVGAVLIASMTRRGRLDYAEIAAIYAGVPAVLTALMYAPWIRRRGAPDDSGRVDLLWVRVRAHEEFQ